MYATYPEIAPERLRLLRQKHRIFRGMRVVRMPAHQGRRTSVEIELPNLLLWLHATHQVLNARLNRRTPLLVDRSSIRGRLTGSATRRQQGNGRNATGQQKDPAPSRCRVSPTRDLCTKI